MAFDLSRAPSGVDDFKKIVIGNCIFQFPEQ